MFNTLVGNCATTGTAAKAPRTPSQQEAIKVKRVRVLSNGTIEVEDR